MDVGVRDREGFRCRAGVPPPLSIVILVSIAANSGMRHLLCAWLCAPYRHKLILLPHWTHFTDEAEEK